MPFAAMFLRLLRLQCIAIVLTVWLSACGGGASAPPPAEGITVTPGGGLVTVSWNMTPGVEYWLMYAPVDSISISNPPSNHLWAINVTSPYVVTGLANGVTYSFSLNARTGGGPGGPGTPSVSAVPRVAGSVWNAAPALGSSTLRALGYGSTSSVNFSYLAVGDAGSVFKSADGIHWSNTSPTAVANFKAGINALDKFLVAGTGGSIYYSNDLFSWGAANANTSATLNALASNGVLAVAVGDAGTVRYSGDGTTWYAAASVPTSANLYGVAYAGNGVWVAVGANGTLLASTDANTWSALDASTSADLHAVTVQTSFFYTFIVVGKAGTVLRSTNGLNWSRSTITPATDLTAVVAGLDQLLAVGSGGAAFTSGDIGATWTRQTTGTTANLYGATGSSSFYLAVGDNGSFVTSR